MQIFKNRKDAGEQLAQKLQNYAGQKDMIILALPRGGVPVAFKIAQKLNYPLDIFLVRKIGIPGSEETAMGAIATGGEPMLNKEIMKYLHLSDSQKEKAINKAKQELEYRNKLYREGKASPNLKGLNVILVDDGMATGATMKAAISAIRKEGAHKIIVAVPVSSDSACAEIAMIADEVISLLVPQNFSAVGLWYQDFPQVSHEEVKKLLSEIKLL